MLNPRCFYEDCLRHGKLDFWAAGMPWALIDSCIDDNSFDYQVDDKSMEFFKDATSLSWDNLKDPAEKLLPCSKCGWTLRCQWTKQRSPNLGETGSYLENDTGYAAKEFSERCPQCAWVMSHDLLRVQKFRNDLQLLRVDDIPMPGTIVPPRNITSHHNHDGDFPNRLLQKSPALDQLLTEPYLGQFATIDDIRRLIVHDLKDAALIWLVKGGTRSLVELLPSDKIACRHMLSHYWDNSSIFGLDLVGAVIRQGSFIKKMHMIDWLHSPALYPTMERLIVKYGRYFQIIGANPGETAVPTLDVDLAWHTHQLSPRKYYEYSLAITKRFVDHDDKIEETKLSNAFKWTSKVYREMFGEIYSECTCWYCEAIRDQATSFFNKLKKLANLDHLHNQSDPNRTAHISAHSVIKAQPNTSDFLSAIHAAKLEASYQRICRRARRKGHSPPARDLPYMTDPCITEKAYGSTLASMNVEPGIIGYCIAGTCTTRLGAGWSSETAGSGNGDAGDDAGDEGGCGGCGGCSGCG